MQRHYSNLSSHAHVSLEERAAPRSGAFSTRNSSSFGGALQPSPNGSDNALRTSLVGWWAIIRPGTDLLFPAELASPTGPAPAGPVGGALKRAFDIGVASLVLLLLSPLLLMIALLIKATMGGPILFAHSRVGLNGKVFRCYKFRTMVNDAEEHLRRYLDQDRAVAREWRETCKRAHGPRMTALGQILRKAGIDELPQFINVLRGDMSCVGPRAASSAELQRDGAYAADYLSMRPGLTGLWQITGRYIHRAELDRLYARNWSLRLDLAILVRTIPAILKADQTGIG